MHFSFDIDGTLTDYPKFWLKYLNIRTVANFSSVEEAKNKLGVAHYEFVKHEYRSGNVKFTEPLREEMINLSTMIYKLGGKIFVNTRRPLIRYPNMKDQTIDWLKREGFKFEDVNSKSIENIEEQKAIFHVDDEITECTRLVPARSLEKIILLTNDFSASSKIHPKVTLVRLDHINELFRGLISSKL